MVKFLLYLLVFPLTIYAMDSVNFNSIFKKSKIVQAKVFYILLIFGMSYLICSFIYDFLYMIK